MVDLKLNAILTTGSTFALDFLGKVTDVGKGSLGVFKAIGNLMSEALNQIKMVSISALASFTALAFASPTVQSSLAQMQPTLLKIGENLGQAIKPGLDVVNEGLKNFNNFLNENTFITDAFGDSFERIVISFTTFAGKLLNNKPLMDTIFGEEGILDTGAGMIEELLDWFGDDDNLSLFNKGLETILEVAKSVWEKLKEIAGLTVEPLINLGITLAPLLQNLFDLFGATIIGALLGFKVGGVYGALIGGGIGFAVDIAGAVGKAQTEISEGGMQGASTWDIIDYGMGRTPVVNVYVDSVKTPAVIMEGG